MKRLVTLCISAVLLCPMWAGAQSTTTTVTAQNQMYFTFSTIQIPSTIVVSVYEGTYNTISSISQYLYLTPYLPNNTSYSFALSGSTFSSSAVYGVPVSGAMVNGGQGYYTVQLNIGTTAIVCSLSTSTLNGTCQGTSSQGPVAVTYKGSN